MQFDIIKQHGKILKQAFKNKFNQVSIVPFRRVAATFEHTFLGKYIFGSAVRDPDGVWEKGRDLVPIGVEMAIANRQTIAGRDWSLPASVHWKRFPAYLIGENICDSAQRGA